MKKTVALFAMVLAGTTLLFACGKAPAAEELIYRGEVTSIAENGDILVTQQAGHNYGQASILFHVSDAVRTSLGETLTQGAFVEVAYSGALTRSIPPQGNAISVTVIASFSEGIVQNGVIQSVMLGKDGYSITILPIGVAATGTDADMNQQTVLTVPMFTLEGLTEADLVAGTQVSAVTRGIATMSLPPIMPVVTLLPYTE